MTVCVGIRKVNRLGRITLPYSVIGGWYGKYVSIWTDGECIFIKPLEEVK